MKLNHQSLNIDATLIDLNDKKDFVNEIKSAMSVEIPVQFVVMKYIHWENILILNQLLKNNKIKRLESKKVKIRDEIIKIETRIEELNHRK